MESERERYGATIGAVWLALAVGLVAAWLLLLANPQSWLLYWQCLSATAALGLAWGLARRWPRLAGVLLVALLGLLCLGSALASGDGRWHAMLVLPVVLAGLLFPPYGAAPTAVVLAALALRSSPSALPAAPVMAAILGTALVLGLGFRATYELYRVHAKRSARAYDLVSEVRERQGELNHMVHALDAAYRLLQESNYQLASARREAEQLRDLKTRFATNLSHELRTPLNVILGFSQLIYRRPQIYGFPGWPESLMRDLVQLQRNAAYLSDLVNDIVDMARVDAVAMPIRREATDLGRVIEEAVRAAAGLAQEKGISLRVDADPGLPELQIDPVRIRQVLFNLLTNAIRFTDVGGITVRTRASAEEVTVSVADTGRGIPADQLEAVFDEYRQVGKPKEDGDGGKGLGLAIARRFVQLHGGRIWATSEVGTGSTFHFTLPCGDKRTSLLTESPGARQPLPTLKPRVLVVDDEDTACAYLRRRLEGYEFVRAATEPELAPLIEALRPVAVLVNSSAGNGDRLPQLAVAPEEMPLLRCNLPSTHWLSGGERFDAVLAKPVAADDLVAAIRALAPGGAPTLAADDDRGFIQFITRALEAEFGGDLSVVPAYNGRDALRKAKRLRPSLVLLDLVMPGVTGFEVLEEIRRDPALAAVKVIAVTAASPGEDDLATRGAEFSVNTGGRRGQVMQLELIAAALGCASGLLGGTGPGGERRESQPAIPAS